MHSNDYIKSIKTTNFVGIIQEVLTAWRIKLLCQIEDSLSSFVVVSEKRTEVAEGLLKKGSLIASKIPVSGCRVKAGLYPLDVENVCVLEEVELTVVDSLVNLNRFRKDFREVTEFFNNFCESLI